jgi:hypothetical protein cdifA_08257
MKIRKDGFYNIISRTIMFISSYFPLYIIIIILYFSKLFKGLMEKNIILLIFTILLVILILVSVVSIILLKQGQGTREKVISNLENPDDTVLSYIMTYIIPLVTNGDNSNEVYIVNVILFVLIGYIYLRLNLIYLNPLWAIFGYLIYRDSNREIIITNISREELRHMEKLKGYYISNDIFVAHKKDNESIKNM